MLVLGFLVSLIVYSKLPDKIATHWDFRGYVNGYSEKTFGLFIVPVLTLVTYLLLKFLPKIDPLEKNIEKFQEYYQDFISQMVAFMLYLQVLVIAFNLGFQVNVSKWVMLSLAVLFWQLSKVMKHAEPNWFIGIRTPWTLSSRRVWKNTHELAARLFDWIAVITLLFFVFPGQIRWFIISMLFAILYLIYYSYKEYMKDSKR